MSRRVRRNKAKQVKQMLARLAEAEAGAERFMRRYQQNPAKTLESLKKGKQLWVRYAFHLSKNPTVRKVPGKPIILVEFHIPPEKWKFPRAVASSFKMDNVGLVNFIFLFSSEQQVPRSTMEHELSHVETFMRIGGIDQFLKKHRGKLRGLKKKDAVKNQFALLAEYYFKHEIAAMFKQDILSGKHKHLDSTVFASSISTGYEKILRNLLRGQGVPADEIKKQLSEFHLRARDIRAVVSAINYSIDAGVPLQRIYNLIQDTDWPMLNKKLMFVADFEGKLGLSEQHVELLWEKKLAKERKRSRTTKKRA
jgi:hypothetical protein